MKKLLFNLIAGLLFILVAQQNFSFAQASLPTEGYEPSLEACCEPIVAGCVWVVKCRPGDGSCSVSSQIPCGEAGG
ncbi:hypothetical protein [Cecembia sp.]|uniref:hypothetical protein n=1 Tax=Cecembia sp. TaxID=1898110 RepID=UPI0025BB4E99|nr:hypothetical protein [Cecembia sp.]